MLTGLTEDLRYGLRVLRSSPGPTSVAVLTLALGIAANTTVFGWIHALLLNPFPGAEASNELVAIETITPSGEFNVSSFKDYRDYRDHTTFSSGMAASLLNPFNLGDDLTAVRVWGECVTSNYFPVLGVKALAGRTFQSSDFGDRTGSHPYVVISHRLWTGRFNSDPELVGKTIRLNRTPMTVLGIAPSGFSGTVPGLALDLWVPVIMAPALNGQGDWLLEDRGQRQFWITARLQPGVTAERAAAEVQSIARRMAEASPKTSERFSATALPIWRAHIGGQGLLLKPLQILMAICVVLFLIVAANVANIQLARATAREKEMGIRLAIGAGRDRLLRQLFTESLLLALLGGAAGVLLSVWLAESLLWLMPPLNLPFALSFSLNYKVLAFMLGLCVCAAVLTGIAPALHAARANVSETLKDNAASSTGSSVHRTRGLLVVTEMALALVALVGTGLFVESFRQARAIHPGFEAGKVLLAQIHVATFCRSNQERSAFVIRLAEHLRGVPGVERVSYADAIPLALGNHPWTDVQVEGYAPAPGEDMRVASTLVGPGFFGALGIPLLEGRDLNDRDTPASMPAVIVNEAFRDRFVGGRDPVGAHMQMRGRRYTIVGLVKNIRSGVLTDAPKPAFYYSYRQTGGGQMWIAFFVRTSGTPVDMISAVRREIRKINPHASVAQMMPYNEYIGAATYPQKVAATLLSGMGAVSLLLAAVGIYSVLSFAVAQRRREFGIRLAMGARPADVLLLVLRQGARLAAFGILAGGALALIAVRFATPLLVGVRPEDPRILGGAAVFLGCIALLASYVPARYAMRVDPMAAVRQQ